ncbi:glutamate N-acetyltransferase [Faunimonas pinastri]|uniref:Arginine biosynthesis bifunctional protein ArgJ n=1 Tax=Faunimonas pinastri TaxID=1855383 RepID=A0A1H9NCR0_9HYPH|nr:bifunctional glutamate N-acetyltransferase/amino-acid acetyltransferase ArgJ [Faunimonas pinastri]SER33163.1 glutamate N-acetyltransferase [Faunimonas pinastri]
MAGKVSPLAPTSYPEMPEIEGVRIATAEAGIRYKGRTDLLFVGFDEGTTVAGVFTRSRCASAPVEWNRARLGKGQARALVVNSGNANAFTGMKGRSSTTATARAAADAARCTPDEVFLASTGVIGEPLDPAPFERHLTQLSGSAGPGRFMDAARAIMTTDTYPKVATRTIEVEGGSVTLNGIAKGAGMIAPDMATMLSFVFTDASVPQETLQACLVEAVRGSFNSITIDSDTSTSDTLMAFATGTSERRGVAAIPASGPVFNAFQEALADICLELAHQVVRDGEGATKFVEVKVTGAVSDESARRIARSIADSPLVKTAVAGQDANWGRVVMAVGKAGEPAERDQLAIFFGEHRVAVDGERDPAYSEEAVSAYMKNSDLLIAVDLGMGSGAAVLWTCDLTDEYVAINADYRS